MCDICKKNTGVDYTITTNDGVVTICPNCVSESIYKHTLNLSNGPYISEISGESGAIRIQSFEIHYDVTPDEAYRLLGHGLMPNEILKLLKTHSDTEYELHDDFYDHSSGISVQPCNDEDYLANLKNYIKSDKLIRGTKKTIMEYIKCLESEEEEVP